MIDDDVVLYSLLLLFAAGSAKFWVIFVSAAFNWIAAALKRDKTIQSVYDFSS